MWQLAGNTSNDVKPCHIISKDVSDLAHTLIQKLRDNGRKRVAALNSRWLLPKKNAKTKAPKFTNRDIFS